MKILKNKVVIAESSGRTIWPKEKYLLKNVLNPKPRQFADFHFLCPDEPEKYLDNYYGTDWKIVGETQSYCHINRQSLNCVRFDMIDYEPAQPFQ